MTAGDRKVGRELIGNHAITSLAEISSTMVSGPALEPDIDQYNLTSLQGLGRWRAPPCPAGGSRSSDSRTLGVRRGLRGCRTTISATHTESLPCAQTAGPGIGADHWCGFTGEFNSAPSKKLGPDVTGEINRPGEQLCSGVTERAGKPNEEPLSSWNGKNASFPHTGFWVTTMKGLFLLVDRRVKRTMSRPLASRSGLRSLDHC